MDYRQKLTEKQKIVIKIGTSTITYPESGEINIGKLEKFVRILINLRNEGKEVIVVSSGAVGIGRNVLGFDKRPEGKAEKQACAAVGQARLMMMYEKIFAEYGQVAAQVLLTKEAIVNESCARNAKQTFEKLSEMKLKCVGTGFFLRFICPIIATPFTFGYCGITTFSISTDEYYIFKT